MKILETVEEISDEEFLEICGNAYSPRKEQSVVPFLQYHRAWVDRILENGRVQPRHSTVKVKS